MANEGERCSQCGAEGAGPRCDACLESDYPSIIVQRGGKWGPLGVALFSLICDVLMIPTVLAIVRAVGELREVARRERLGFHREEHAKVRTGAVWAILIASARPLAFVMVFLIAGVSAMTSKPMHPVLPADELGEILERLRAEDEESGDLALGHLEELAPALSLHDIDRVLGALDAGFGLDEESEVWLRAAVIGAIAGSPLILERSERVAGVYRALPFDAREEVLRRFVAIGGPVALAQFAVLAGGDTDPEGPILPLPLGMVAPNDAAIFVGPLVRLPADASLRALVPLMLSSLCDGGVDESVLEPVRERLIADWHETRDALPPPAPSLEVRTGGDHGGPVLQARLQLAALRCVEGADVDALLLEASAHPDTSVAVAAARALIARGRSVSHATIARLAADPFSRADLFAALRERGREQEMPEGSRTERALAEGQLIRQLRFDGGDPPLIAYRWVERVEPRRGAGVHVFAVTARDGTEEPQHVVIGPYPEALTTDDPRTRWMSEGESTAALAAALVDERDEEQDALEDLDDLDLDDLDGDPL